MEIERAASFYLGKQSTAEGVLGEPVLYDARDLTTHAVCIGMTGSGKTGLGAVLLEEAALDGVPSIVIDPKGDMTNLLLTFPELRASDFHPWVNVDDARRKGQSTGEYAASVAELWSNGLDQWGESGERIRRLRDAADFRIYTPGSDAGLPVSLLQSFSPPDLSWRTESEALRETISGTVSGLLALLGIEADPVRSREHILLSTILERAWREGEDMDLTRLIRAIQDPPMRTLGVMDLDVVYPEADRFKLAMSLNSILASPSFQSWRQGTPLQIDRFLESHTGKPQVSVFYLAHLSDAERMFFITLLLEQVLAWMRQQSGTTSLRGLLYIDEMFGTMPPYPANPPTKRPLLALLKTARAFGLGLVLTTQNPVDLDYKGLTNAGTWFIGKLQTDRDKARVLEGMEGVVAEAGTMLDRGHLDRLISSLRSRTFVLHNVHEERPILLHTRWAMSYLRGPLTREQVRQVMSPFKDAADEGAQDVGRRGRGAAERQMSEPSSPQIPAEALAEYAAVRPQVSGRVAQYVLPVALSADVAARRIAESVSGPLEFVDTRLGYRPYLVGLATVTYSDSKHTGQQQETLGALLRLPGPNQILSWSEHLNDSLRPQDLSAEAHSDALFGDLPEAMTDSPPYTKRRDEFSDWLYSHRSLPAWEHDALDLYSHLDESEEAFRERVLAAANRALEEERRKLAKDFDRDIERVEDRIKREEQELDEDMIDLRGRRQEEALSAGESLLSLVLGRRRSRALSQASRRRRMTQKARADVEESEREIEDLKDDLKKLREEKERATEQLGREWADASESIISVPIAPRRSDVRMQAFGLGWVPHWVIAYRDRTGSLAWREVPAYPAERDKGERQQ